MGALDEEIARQRAANAAEAARPPIIGGFVRYEAGAGAIKDAFDEFCGHLTPRDGEPAAYVVHNGTQMLFDWPPKLKSYNTSAEGVRLNRERIRWLTKSDQRGGRLLQIRNYDGSLNFGRAGDEWFPVVTDTSFHGFGVHLDINGTLVKWLVEHGRV